MKVERPDTDAREKRPASTAKPRTILLLHGRNDKPKRLVLQTLWTRAIRHGLTRDRPEALDAFDAADVGLIYYGDLSAAWLDHYAEKTGTARKTYDHAWDVADREASIDRLMQRPAEDFTRSGYARMRGESPLYEAVADFLEHPLRLLGLGERAVQAYAPEMAEYWADVHFGSDLRLVATDALQVAMERESERGGEIALLSHSLGTLIAYDVAWKLSHYGEYRRMAWNRPIDLFVTMGAPLGNSTIRSRLKGAGVPVEFRYPTNIRQWHNLAAEDDIIAHDEDLANDFAGSGLSITDHRIYNPAIRRGRVNPHYGAGYLLNPVTANLLADWLLGNATR